MHTSCRGNVLPEKNPICALQRHDKDQKENLLKSTAASLTRHKHQNLLLRVNFFGIFGTVHCAEGCKCWEPGKTHTAGQGSFWQLVWLSSGRVKGSHQCSSTIPLILSTQWTICLWTPARAEKAQLKAQTCCRTVQVFDGKYYIIDVKKKKRYMNPQRCMECGDVRQQNTKHHVKVFISRGSGGFVLLCGNLQSFFSPSWGDISPSEKETPLTSAGSVLCMLRATVNDWELGYTFRAWRADLLDQKPDRLNGACLTKMSWHSKDIMK